MKQPWLKWYPTDWRADPALRMCSLAARGLWIEMLGYMHESDPYGYLLVRGVVPSEMQLAVLVGAEAKLVRAALAELDAAGVLSRNESGVIYSRRMLRDKAKADFDADNGGRGGNPSLNLSLNGGVNPSVNGEDKAQKLEARSQKKTKASSASPPPGFLEFWRTFPPIRRVAKAKCAESWNRQGCEPIAMQILAHVAAMMRTSEQWREGYSPSPATYLNQRRWEDDLPAPPKRPAL